MSNEEYIEPNKKAQVALLLTFVAILVFGVILNSMVDPLRLDQDASLEEIKISLGLLFELANKIIFIGCIIGLFAAWHFGRIGYLALKKGIFPPPGSIVVARTRIRIGKEATLLGYISIFIAFLLGLFFPLMGFLVKMLSHLTAV